MSFIRADKVGDTKRALAENGFPSFSCRKCLGRGKVSASPELIQAVLSAGELPLDYTGQHFTEATRLIAKRFFTLIVDDGDVRKVVDIIIAANQTGHKGDGKIFVLPILEAYTVRSGEATVEAY